MLQTHEINWQDHISNNEVRKTSAARVDGDARADWPTGKPGDFPVGPCFRKFIGPPDG